MKAGRTEKAKEYVRKSFDLTEYENWEGNSAVIASMGAVFYIESAMIDKLNVTTKTDRYCGPGHRHAGQKKNFASGCATVWIC